MPCLVITPQYFLIFVPYLFIGSTDLFSWGNGANYQLGTGNTDIQKLPYKVEALQGLLVKEISAAKFHSVAVTALGELYTWGFGRGGRLGHPDFDIHRYGMNQMFITNFNAFVLQYRYIGERACEVPISVCFSSSNMQPLIIYLRAFISRESSMCYPMYEKL